MGEKKILLFYTFCCYIGRIEKNHLIRALNLLLNSIHKHIPNYKLICYRNFFFNNMLTKNIKKKYNIEFRPYYNNKRRLYKDKWKNLSFNKINIYKDLYDEFKKDFCWIDLDTIICFDISYINDLENIFIENGGNCLKRNVLFSNNKEITIPRNRYIQGNFWKINIKLYNNLIKTLNYLLKKKVKLRYDLQDLFTWYIYKKDRKLYPSIKKLIDAKNINILGRNIRLDTLNGLAVWSKEGNTHANFLGLKNLYINEDNILKSIIYPNKTIHILSFTFKSLKQLYYTNKFKKLFIN